MQAYPALYNWTTYPLTTALDIAYKIVKTQEQKTNEVSASLIEFTSVIERGINFMHTGHAGVISTSVMNPLHIGLALIYDGLPCFNNQSVTLRPGMIQVHLAQWPFDHLKFLPRTSAKCALSHEYGMDFFNVRII
jgi:hypothetical protein